MPHGVAALGGMFIAVCCCAVARWGCAAVWVQGSNFKALLRVWLILPLCQTRSVHVHPSKFHRQFSLASTVKARWCVNNPPSAVRFGCIFTTGVDFDRERWPKVQNGPSLGLVCLEFQRLLLSSRRRVLRLYFISID
ncbi:hypothetical protein BC628DRAFT_125767 [Trametes gibbosa]|nr:hypothetical protein BC628DRAFT_125767 [Trametes gibbosa]